MDKKEFGRRLKKARQHKGYTQEILAEQVNITVVYLSEVERGLKLPSLPLFVSLVNALSVSADELLCDDLESGKQYIYHDITKQFEQLTPQQRVSAAAILEAYIHTL